MIYFNEFDKDAAAWLQGLVDAEVLPAAHIDTRSITEVSPHDLKGYTQCHFFAGIGIWSVGLTLARFSPDRPVWTGSCPCQPFSDAGAGKGFDDPRHLWPTWFRLIRECRPATVFGEQVASKDGLAWFDHVSTDLENEGYAVGSADLCAAGLGAFHIRQRLYWGASLGMAAAEHERHGSLGNGAEGRGKPISDRRMGDTSGGGFGKLWHETWPGSGGHADGSVELDRLVNADDEGSQGHDGNVSGGNQPGREHQEPPGPAWEASGLDGMVLADGDGRQQGEPSTTTDRHGDTTQPASGARSAWSDIRSILCSDGKHRIIPTQPAFQPLVDARRYVVPNVARHRTVSPALLKGPGNAIVPQVAALFIEAFLETLSAPVTSNQKP